MNRNFSTARDRYITVQGMRLRVRICGDGAPLLLLNGLGGCLEGWEPLATRLASRQLVMVDHPGMGRSGAPTMPMTIRDLAAMYMELLDQLDVQRCDVLGFSFGGTLAQQIAHDFPDRVNSLILTSTSCGWGGFPADPFTLMAASNPMRYRFTAVREISAPILYRGRVGRDPELFETELKGWRAHKASLAGVFYQIAAFSMWSSLPWLHTLTQPTLVLGGAEDPMAPAINSRLLAARIPNAELHVLVEGGHLFPFDRADEVSALVNAFLVSHQPIVDAA